MSLPSSALNCLSLDQSHFALLAESACIQSCIFLVEMPHLVMPLICA
ncbi:hypothetical protein COLO4_12306 [Corchorus olitorius]|uniref:Uncharacterized protein n=1 Tax=Corchorus olitorius TaxID=93759 RepID=A0A1R3K1A7_9ROSI|nr:hypothetical protein COLO4_12306 [Corchorus olitorius]